MLAYADGAIAGTILKRDGDTDNEVDYNRVRKFMSVVEQIRKEA